MGIFPEVGTPPGRCPFGFPLRPSNNFEKHTFDFGPDSQEVFGFQGNVASDGLLASACQKHWAYAIQATRHGTCEWSPTGDPSTRLIFTV